MKGKVQLWSNYSHHVLTKAQADFLNLGLNFVPIPTKVNRTEVEASFQHYDRSMKWKEYWHREDDESSQEEDDEGGPDKIFPNKMKKTNLPRNHPTPHSLVSCGKRCEKLGKSQGSI